MQTYREEQDSIGTKRIPATAYYGVQSLRGYENFRITGQTVHPALIRAMAEIKLAAAKANERAGVLEPRIATAIITACNELLAGRFGDAFIVDALQGGAGTSMNMNANEVIANRAIELLGGQKGDYTLVHPNDHVDCGQSTNDVVPSAGRIAAIRLLNRAADKLGLLQTALSVKAAEYGNVIKMGRTELQDAVPISFSQVFGAWASAVARDIRRFRLAAEELSTVNMGATAIGTAINAHPAYIRSIVPVLAEVTALPLTQAEDLVDATQNIDSFVHVSGIVKSCAVTLSKMANDLRLMSSGPRTGLGEIVLEPRQNGSSIMPGKVNPVIPEAMNQIAFVIIGNDTTVTLAAEAGQLELNAFGPVVFHRLFESLDILSSGVDMFVRECINGITVNAEACRGHVENSIGIVTALCPHIGYKRAAEIAKKALREGKNIRDAVKDESIMADNEIDRILDPMDMIGL